jgi:hypothetical protein
LEQEVAQGRPTHSFSIGAEIGVQTPETPSAVHRVFREGKPKFQLRKGEEGLSVFDADKLLEAEILPNFRSGSRLSTQQRQFIESFGLKIEKTPGDSSLPQNLQENHWEIHPGDGMTRNQFKATLRMLDDAAME